jgi:hypothetical protein
METYYCGKCRLDWVPDRYVATEHGLKPQCPVCELQSQLAAQAAAVEVLGKVEAIARRRQLVVGQTERGLVCIHVREYSGQWTNLSAYGETLPEALAALVAAAGKEDGK